MGDTNAKIFVEFEVLNNLKQITSKIKTLENQIPDIKLNIDDKELKQEVLKSLSNITTMLANNKSPLRKLDLSKILPQTIATLGLDEEVASGKKKLGLIQGLEDSLTSFSKFAKMFIKGSSAEEIASVFNRINSSFDTPKQMEKFLRELKDIYNFIDSLKLKASDKESLVRSFTGKLTEGLTQRGLEDALGLKNINLKNGDAFKDVNKYAVSVREARLKLYEELQEWKKLSLDKQMSSPITKNIMGYISRIENFAGLKDGEDIVDYIQNKLNTDNLKGADKKLFEALSKDLSGDGGFLEKIREWSSSDSQRVQNAYQSIINVNQQVYEMTKAQLKEINSLKEKREALTSSMLTEGMQAEQSITYTGNESEEELPETERMSVVRKTASEIRKQIDDLRELAKLQKETAHFESDVEKVEMQGLRDEIDNVIDKINEKNRAFSEEEGIVSSVVKSEKEDLNKLKTVLEEIANFNKEEDKVGAISKPREELEDKVDKMKGSILDTPKKEDDKKREAQKEEVKQVTAKAKVRIKDTDKNMKDNRLEIEKTAESLKQINDVFPTVNSNFDRFGEINKNIYTDVSNLSEALEKEANALKNIDTKMKALDNSDLLRKIAKPRYEKELEQEEAELENAQKELDSFNKIKAKYISRTFNGQDKAKQSATTQLRSAFRDLEGIEGIDEVTAARKRMKWFESYNEAQKRQVSDKTLERYRFDYGEEEYAKDTEFLKAEFKRREDVYEQHANKIKELQNRIVDIENIEKKAVASRAKKARTSKAKETVSPISEQDIGIINQDELNDYYEQALAEARDSRKEYEEEIDSLFQEQIEHKEREIPIEIEPNYENISEEAKKAADAKKDFIEQNNNIPPSIGSSVPTLQDESQAFADIAKNASAAAEAKKEFATNGETIIGTVQGVISRLKQDSELFEEVMGIQRTGKKRGAGNTSEDELTWEEVNARAEKLFDRASYIQHTESLFGKGHPELSEYQMFDVETDNIKEYMEVMGLIEKQRDRLNEIFNGDAIENEDLMPEDGQEVIDYYYDLLKIMERLKLTITAPDSQENLLLSINKSIAENTVEKYIDRDAIYKEYNALLNDKKFVNDNEFLLSGKIQLQDLDEAGIETITTSALRNIRAEMKIVKQELSSAFTIDGDLVPDADLSRVSQLLEKYKELRTDANRLVGVVSSPNSDEQVLYNSYRERIKKQDEERSRRDKEEERQRNREAFIRDRATLYASKKNFITGSDIRIKDEYDTTGALEINERGEQYKEAVKHVDNLRSIIKDITYDPITGEMKDLNELTSIELEGLNNILDDYEKWADVAKRLKAEITQIGSEESKWVEQSKKEAKNSEEQEKKRKAEDKKTEAERQLSIKNLSKLSNDKSFIQGTDVGDIDEYINNGISSNKISNYVNNKNQANILRKVIKDYLYDETTGTERDLSTLDEKQLATLEEHVKRYQYIISTLKRLRNEITSPDSAENAELEIKKLESAEKKVEEADAEKARKKSISSLESDYKKTNKDNLDITDDKKLRQYLEIDDIRNTENFGKLIQAYDNLGKAKQELDKYFKDGKLIDENSIGDAQKAIDVYKQLTSTIKELKENILSTGSEENTILRARQIDSNFTNGAYQGIINAGNKVVNKYGVRDANGEIAQTGENEYVLQLIQNIEKLKKAKVEFDEQWNNGNIKNKESLDKIEEEIDETTLKIAQLTSSIKKGIPQATSEQMSSLASRISEFVSANPHLSQKGIGDLKGYFDILQSGASVSIDKLNELEAGFERVAASEKDMGNLGGNVFNTMLGKIREGIAYLGTKFSFYQIFNQIRQGIDIVHQFDDALTEMQKVSDETIGSLQRYQKTTFDVAASIGANALQIQNSTADFMRLGESLEEAAESARVANVLMNVSEFSSIDEATKSLIAMSAAYDDLDKSDIIDKLNEVGNNYSISTSGAAEALQASASALKTAGNNMDEALALVTAGNQVVQDTTKAGTGLRTIALRLTGTKSAKDELEELGEDTDAMLTTQSKLRDTIMEATAVASNNWKGFDILDDNGNYKSTYEIMLGISRIYQEILDTDKKFGRNNANLLLETVAGKVRANIAASIFQSPDILEEAYRSSMQADNSAMIENEKYMQSISGHMAQLTNAWQELWANTATRDLINGFIDLAKSAIEAANAIGLVPTALGAITAYTAILQWGSGKGIFTALLKDLASFSTVTETLDAQGEAMSFVLDKTAGSFSNVGESMSSLTSKTSLLKKAWAGLINVIKNADLAAKVGMGAIGGALIAFAAVSAYRNYLDEQLSNAKQGATAWNDREATVKGLIEEYSEAKTKLDSNTLSEEEMVTTKEKILDIQNKINEQYDTQGKKIDLINGDLEEQLKILENISAVEASNEYAKNKSGFDEAIKRLNEENNYTIEANLDASITGLNPEDYGLKADDTGWYHINQTTSDAIKNLTAYRDELMRLRNEATNEFDRSALQERIEAVDAALQKAIADFEDFGETGLTALEVRLRKGDFGEGQYKIFSDYVEAVGDYEEALLSGEIDEVYTAKEAYEEATVAKDKFLSTGNNYQLAPLFDSIDTSLLVPQQQSVDAAEILEMAKRTSGVSEAEYKRFQGYTQAKEDLKEYVGTLSEVERITGNIDHAERPLMFWDKNEIKEQQELLKSWGISVENWNKSIDSSNWKYLYTTSLGRTGNWGGNEIAFTPVIRDANGKGQLLTPENVNNYINTLVSSLGEGWSPEQLLALDAEGLVVDGIEIKNIIADVGDSAKNTVASMKSLDDSIYGEIAKYKDEYLAELELGEEYIEQMSEAGMVFDEASKSSNQFAGNLVEIGGLYKALKRNKIYRTDVEDMFATEGMQQYEVAIRRLMSLLGYTENNQAEFIDHLVRTGYITGSVADYTNVASEAYNNFSQEVAKAIENVASLNTVLSESVSGKGISTQNLDAYRQMFGEDAEYALERSANGYHINAEKLQVLIREQEALKKASYQDTLDAQYDSLRRCTEEIIRMGDAGEDTSGLVAQRQGILQQIQATQDLMMNYEAATSAYQTWQNAQSNGSERDMYETIGSGFDTVKDLIDRGWSGDDTVRSFLDLIYGSSFDAWTASGEELVEMFEKLDEKIAGTNFSIRDFFQVDENGKLTSNGIFNFFDAVEQKQKELNKEWITYDENGNRTYDFGIGGDRQLAEALGMDVELVQSILRAAVDAGFELNLDQPMWMMDELEKKAVSAQEELEGFNNINFDQLYNNLDKEGAYEEITGYVEQVQDYISTIEKSDLDPEVKTKKLEQANDILAYLVALEREAADRGEIDLKANIVGRTTNKALSLIEEIGDVPDELKAINWSEITDEEGLRKARAMVQALSDSGAIDTSTAEQFLGLLDKALYELGLIDSYEASPTISGVSVDSYVQAQEQLEEFRKKLALIQEMSDKGIEYHVYEDEGMKTLIDNLLAHDKELKMSLGIDPDATTEDILKLIDEGEFNLDAILDLTWGGNGEEPEKTGGSVQGSKQPTGYVREETTNKKSFETVTRNEEYTITSTADTSGFDATQEEEQETQDRLDIINNSKITPQSDTSELETVQVEAKADKHELDELNKTWHPRVSLVDSASGATGLIQKAINSLTGKSVYIDVEADTSALDRIISKASTAASKLAEVAAKSLVNGSAHYMGTAFAKGSLSGNAFRSGNWGLSKAQTALTGELGTEIVVRDGQWFTVGENGAEFTSLRKGDIVFNHKQSESLLENGYITGSNGRGHLVGFANGTAYSSGTTAGATRAKVKTSSTGSKSSSSGSSGSGGSGGSSGGDSGSSNNEQANDFLETLDEIEIKLDRIEREISTLDTIAGNTYYNYSVRNNALIKDLSKVSEEIDLQRKAYARYIQQANSVGLSEDWAKKVRQGAINIEDVKDEDLWNKISKYREW